MALTCTSFQDPALDALWYQIDSFEPIVCCLPTRVYFFSMGVLVSEWLGMFYQETYIIQLSGGE